MKHPIVGCLNKKIILITGASSGLGRCLAKTCAQYGATVILSGRNISALTTLYDEIVALGHPEPKIYPLNLATATIDDYQQLADDLSKHFSYLSGIVHNAAMLGNLSPLAEYTAETWYQVWQVNFNSRLFLTQALLPQLKKAPNANVLLIAPEPGEYAKAYWGAFSITASANQQLVKVWTDELTYIPSLRINMLCPPPMRTALRASAYPASKGNNYLEPKDCVTNFIHYLSDANTSSGQIINIATTKIPENTTSI